MVQKKLPLINSAHGTETRNIINELIRIFNSMGYTYDEALSKAHDVLNEAQQTNDMNKNVQQQIDNVIKGVADPTSEVAQARGPFELLNQRLEDYDKQNAGLETNVAHHGIFPNGNDYTEQLKALIQEYDTFVFPKGEYLVSDELLFKHGQSIRAIGPVTFKSHNFNGVSGNSVLRVSNQGSNYTKVISLTSDINKGDIQLDFNGAHELNVGDIICLYDNTDFSYSTKKSYYRKGEFCKVASVINSESVLLDSELFDDYSVLGNLNFGIYKMNVGTFNIEGNLTIIQNTPGNFIAAAFERLVDFNVRNLKTLAMKGSYTACQFIQCYNTDYKGTAIQEKLSGLGGDYGLAILNCQHFRGDGYFSGSRHGLMHGGYSGIGAVTNRDINTGGTVKGTDPSGASAFNCHGNVDHISFEGKVFGGITLAGNNTKIKGSTTVDAQGIAVLFSDIKGFNHDLSGLKISSEKSITAAGNRSVIDFGAAGEVEVDYMLGGIIDLSDIVIDAPLAKNGIYIRTRNTKVLQNEKLGVKVNNAILNIGEIQGGHSLYVNGANDYKYIDFLDAEGMYSKNGDFLALRIDRVKMPKKKGTTSYTTNTNTNNIVINVTFDKPFPAGYSPHVTVALDRRAIGSEVICKATNFNESGFTVTINTIDSSKFPSIVNGVVSWLAE